MPISNNRASLGCGTLILIALIVMIFGGANRGNDKEVAQQLRNLQSEVNVLKSDIANQSVILGKIKQSLDESSMRARQPRPRVVTPPLPPDGTTPELDSSPLPAEN